MTSLAKNLRRCPPFMVFALAKKSRFEKLSIEEVAQRSKLSVRTCERISIMLDWSSVKIGVAERFCSGCGIDPIRRRFIASDRMISKYFWQVQSEGSLRPMIHLTEREYHRFIERVCLWKKMLEKQVVKQVATRQP